jgi:hypothetical protein
MSIGALSQWTITLRWSVPALWIMYRGKRGDDLFSEASAIHSLPFPHDLNDFLTYGIEQYREHCLFPKCTAHWIRSSSPNEATTTHLL